MGAVLWHMTMSLDGFIAGPDDAMGWVFEHPGPNETRERGAESPPEWMTGTFVNDGIEDAVARARAAAGDGCGSGSTIRCRRSPCTAWTTARSSVSSCMASSRSSRRKNFLNEISRSRACDEPITLPVADVERGMEA